MTERIYFRDAALLEFDASVIAHAGGDTRVILDRTAFYPTSGGQPYDTGRLGPAHVLDVIEEGDSIVHVVDTALPPGPVHGSVDARRRFDHMQQHTAQHLLSALAADRHGWQTESVHFGPQHSTIEFDTPAIDAAVLARLQLQANRVIAEARSVTVTMEDAVDAQRAGLRKPTDRTGEIRVITIAGLDRSACGGTHVGNTSAIGMIALHGVERVRNHVRVGFVAGERVVAELAATRAALAAVADIARCSVDELPALVTRRLQELKDASARAESLETEVAAARIQALVAAQPANAQGITRVVYRAEGEPVSMLRAMGHAVQSLGRVILVASTTMPPAIHVATSAGSGVDAGAVLKTALAQVGGRGGGSARLAQGSVPDASLLDALTEQLAR